MAYLYFPHRVDSCPQGPHPKIAQAMIGVSPTWPLQLVNVSIEPTVLFQTSCPDWSSEYLECAGAQVWLLLMPYPKIGLEILGHPCLKSSPYAKSDKKKIPPLAWTTSTIGFHASTCSFVHMPGVCGYLKIWKIPKKENKITKLKGPTSVSKH